jgi:hypothetical protein
MTRYTVGKRKQIQFKTLRVNFFLNVNYGTFSFYPSLIHTTASTSTVEKFLFVTSQQFSVSGLDCSESIALNFGLLFIPNFSVSEHRRWDHYCLQALL